MTKLQTSLFRHSVNLFISEFLYPLKRAGITQFSHSMTFGNHQLSALGSSIDVSNYFNKDKIPAYCCDEKGRILDDGICTNTILASMHPDFAMIYPLLSKVGKKFRLNYGKHSLHIMQNAADCQHLFAFHFDLEENDFLHWSLNNGQFICDTIEIFNTKGNDLILEGKEERNRSTRNTVSEFNFSRYLKNHNNGNTIKLMHKNMNIPVHYSPQQSKCLQLHIAGKTVKSIAQTLQLSPRTVESYLKTIRIMVDCSTGKELISLYYDSLNKK